MTTNLPYGPPVNTDIGYYRTVFGRFCVSVAMLLVVVRGREANACLKMLSTKQGSHWYHF